MDLERGRPINKSTMWPKKRTFITRRKVTLLVVTAEKRPSIRWWLAAFDRQTVVSEDQLDRCLAQDFGAETVRYGM